MSDELIEQCCDVVRRIGVKSGVGSAVIGAINHELRGIIESLQAKVEELEAANKDKAQLLASFKARLAKYDELIFAVEKKFPNETRHETALRYIRERESACSGPQKSTEDL